MLAPMDATATPENEAATPVAKAATRRKGRMPRRLFSLAVILAVLWCGYWFVAYTLAHSVVRDATAAENQADPLLSCLERAFGGFPLQLTLRCEGAIAATADMRASIGHVAAAAPLYRPGQVTADVVGPFRLEAPGLVLDAAWRDGAATVDTGLIGPTGARVTFTAFNFALAETAGVPLFSARAGQWGSELRPATGEADSLRLVLSADDLVMTLGTVAFPELSGEATIILLGSGDQINRNPLDVFRAWLRAGGHLEVDHALLTSGAVEADIRGPLTLGADGTLSGDLTVRYTGQEDLGLLVQAIFPWAADAADLVAEAIVAMSHPVEIRGEPGLEVRLLIDRGLIKYGLFPIVTIPSLGSLAHLL